VGRHKGGGGHQFYTHGLQDGNTPFLPTIVAGMDINAVVSVLKPRMSKLLEALRAGEPAQELDKDELNSEMARLPDQPDEELR
jgi:hypothetical protein